MSKYYKAEEVQILINSLKCYGIPELNFDGLPAIEVKEGEWIPDPDGGFKCSNCRAEEDEFIYGTGMRYVNGESEFCPNCGARMKGADDE